jgi:hypothetical protein
MNKANEFIPFCELWTATHDIMAAGKVFKQNHMILIFEDLEHYRLDVIKQAVKRHRQTAKFAPTPNDIIEIIEDVVGNKHLGVEEAWAKALPMIGDDDSSFIVTKEIMEALGIAESLYHDGDRFSAARAFKEKYASLIKNAPAPEWFVTLGDDKQQRIEVINEASKLNLLASNHADQLLLGLNKPSATASGLIEESLKKTNPEKAKANLAGLKLVIDNSVPKKTKAEQIKEHNLLIKSKALEAIAQLKRDNPEAFAKPSVEIQLNPDYEVVEAAQ